MIADGSRVPVSMTRRLLWGAGVVAAVAALLDRPRTEAYALVVWVVAVSAAALYAVTLRELPRERGSVMTDEGLSFHAIVKKADGTRLTRETPNRDELLTWVAQHCAADDVLQEVGMVATGPAATQTLNALTFGAERIKRRD